MWQRSDIAFVLKELQVHALACDAIMERFAQHSQGQAFVTALTLAQILGERVTVGDFHSVCRKHHVFVEVEPNDLCGPVIVSAGSSQTHVRGAAGSHKAA